MKFMADINDRLMVLERAAMEQRTEAKLKWRRTKLSI
jgi:hypothetical protein